MVHARAPARRYRNKPAIIASIVAPCFINLLFGGIFAHAGDVNNERQKASCDSGETLTYTLQGHYGAIAQVMIGGMFGAAQPLLLRFPLDRGLFLREYATSTFGVGPYFVSKTLVELPQQFLNALLTWACFYPIVGLQGNWIIHVSRGMRSRPHERVAHTSTRRAHVLHCSREQVSVFWLAGLSAASTALLVGCLAANAEAASQGAPPIFVLQLLFAGVFIPIDQIPCGLRWIQYIASLKYGINLVMINEFGEHTQVHEGPGRRANAPESAQPRPWTLALTLALALCRTRRIGEWRSARRRTSFWRTTTSSRACGRRTRSSSSDSLSCSASSGWLLSRTRQEASCEAHARRRL